MAALALLMLLPTTLALPDGPDLFAVDPADLAEYDRQLDEQSPHVDAFGQPRHLDWPGKIASTEDLRAADTAQGERLAELPTIEPKTLPRQPPARTWRLLSVGGRPRLVRPDGRPIFYLGVDGATDAHGPTTPIDGRRPLFADLPDRTTPLATAGYVINPDRTRADLGVEFFDHRAANLVRKFGVDWKPRNRRHAADRLEALGFTGAGRVTDPLALVSHLPIVSLPEDFAPPTPWLPEARRILDGQLRQQISARRTDPSLVAWVVEPDPLPTPQDTAAILAEKGGDVKQALLNAALDEEWRGSEGAMLDSLGIRDAERAIRQPLRLDEEGLAKLHRVHRRAVAALLRDAFDQAAGAQLTAGDPAWADIALLDVPVGGDVAETLGAAPNGPILLTLEHPVDYDGRRGFRPGEGTFATEADAGARYADDLAAAMADERVVGVLLRHWADDPPTGTGPGDRRRLTLVQGPAAAAGLVDVTDRLKWDYAAAIHAANAEAAESAE